MSFRRDAIAFYKSALRVTRNWKAVNECDTKVEQEFLKKTIRGEMMAMKEMKSDPERQNALAKLSNWLDTCSHYKIPYPKPYYFQSGASMKQARSNVM